MDVNPTGNTGETGFKTKKFNNGTHTTGNTGVSGNQTYSKFEANVPGLPKENVFVYGIVGQVEKFLKSKKGIIEWVGTNKEYKNSMMVYLQKKEAGSRVS